LKVVDQEKCRTTLDGGITQNSQKTFWRGTSGRYEKKHVLREKVRVDAKRRLQSEQKWGEREAVRKKGGKDMRG